MPFFLAGRTAASLGRRVQPVAAQLGDYKLITQLPFHGGWGNPDPEGLNQKCNWRWPAPKSLWVSQDPNRKHRAHSDQEDSGRV